MDRLEEHSVILIIGHGTNKCELVRRRHRLFRLVVRGIRQVVKVSRAHVTGRTIQGKDEVSREYIDGVTRVNEHIRERSRRVADVLAAWE
jgi:hypothetical protein